MGDKDTGVWDGLQWVCDAGILYQQGVVVVEGLRFGVKPDILQDGAEANGFGNIICFGRVTVGLRLIGVCCEVEERIFFAILFGVCCGVEDLTASLC